MFELLKLTDHQKGLLYASTTAACWGVLAILLKNALNFADPQTIVAFRMIFALSVALPLTALSQPKHLKILKYPPLLLILGSFGLAYNYLGFMNGVALSSASNAQVMIQTGPLLLMLSGFFLYKEALNLKQGFWLAVALLGFVCFFSDQISSTLQSQLLLANAWILTAALAWVGYSLVVRHFTRQGYSASELNLVVFLVCAITLSFGMNWNQVSNFDFFEWAFMFVLGLNTLIAYGCFGAALKYAPASQVSVIITTNPILTLAIITFGGAHFSFIPNEPVHITGYIGAALVVVGVMFSTKSAQKK